MLVICLSVYSTESKQNLSFYKTTKIQLSIIYFVTHCISFQFDNDQSIRIQSIHKSSSFDSENFRKQNSIVELLVVMPSSNIPNQFNLWIEWKTDAWKFSISTGNHRLSSLTFCGVQQRSTSQLTTIDVCFGMLDVKAHLDRFCVRITLAQECHHSECRHTCTCRSVI